MSAISFFSALAGITGELSVKGRFPDSSRSRTVLAAFTSGKPTTCMGELSFVGGPELGEAFMVPR